MLGFLIQSIQVCLVRFRFGIGCITIRFELMGTMCRLNGPHTALGSFFQFVRTFHAHIIVFRFTNFSVSGSYNGIQRRSNSSMGKFGRRFLFINLLEIEPCGDFAIGVDDTLFFLDGFLRDFCLGFFQLVRLFICFANCLFQFRCRSFLFGKLQPWRTLTHKASPPGVSGLGNHSTLM